MAPSTSATDGSPATEQERDLDLDGEIVYEFACRRALPRVDCRKTIKHAILSPRALVHVNRMLHRTKIWVPVWYAVGLVCGSLVLFVPNVAIIPSANRWLGITTLVLGLPSHGTAFLALRFDMVKLVTRTFEFWYITLLNASTTALLCETVRDMRALAIVSATLAFQVAFCIDAIYRAPRVAITATAFGAITNALFIVALGFQFLPNIHRFKLVAIRSREITSDDLITNALATVAVLLTRNAYRKYQSLRPAASVGPSARTAVGTCITYRCCLELRPRVIRTDHVASDARQTALLARSGATGSLTQLRYVGSTKSFNARNLMIPRSLLVLSLRRWSRSSQFMLWFLCATSLMGLMCYHALDRLMEDAWHGWRVVVSLVAFLSAVGFCGVYFAHSQRELLLRELGRSFDFLFVATQIFCAHLCVCDLYAWDLRCVNVATNWLWAQWMLTLDAVTPVMKRKLGFHKAGAAVVGLVLLFQQVVLITTVFRRGGYSTRLQHRILFSLRIGDRTLDVSVVSVLLGRILVTWLWSLRIGWRLFDRQGAELLVLQGQLQYDEDVGVRKLTMAPTAVDAATRLTAHAVALT